MAVATKNKAVQPLGSGKISRSGQVTVPAEIRRIMGLEPGDTVVYGRNNDGEITIRKPRTASELVGIARSLPKGTSVSELIKETDRTPMVRSRYQKGS